MAPNCGKPPDTITSAIQHKLVHPIQDKKLIGIVNNTIYYCVKNRDVCDAQDVTLFSLNIFEPTGEKKVEVINMITTGVYETLLDTTEQIIYLFIVGQRGNDNIFKSFFYVYSIKTQTLKHYILDEVASRVTIADLAISNVHMRKAGNHIYLIDLTVVNGSIPCWEIHPLDSEPDKVFHITECTIPEPARILGFEGVRYPVMLYGQSRKILRLGVTNKIIIYDESENEWSSYLPDENLNKLRIQDFETHGVGESYGSFGHRYRSIESKLTLIVSGQKCFFKIFDRGLHYTYSFEYDTKTKKYWLTPLSCVRFPKNVFQFFTAINEHFIVALGTRSITIMPMVPFTLKQLCIWHLHRNFASNTADGYCAGQNLRRIFGNNIPGCVFN